MKKDSKNQSQSKSKPQGQSKSKPQSLKRQSIQPGDRWTIGMDLGDKNTRYCVLNEQGEVNLEASVATTPAAIAKLFARLPRCRIGLEVGGHSPWISRLLEELGHEVIVANARRVHLISKSSKKDDRIDARTLARLVRMDPDLLSPIRHRSKEAQMDLLVIRLRAQLVEVRTGVINSVRGSAKAMGARVPACDADHMDGTRLAGLPMALQARLKPMLEQVESLTKQIHDYDQQIQQIAGSKYPETARLTQVSGVGTLIALTYVLTIDDKQRFGKSRDVGCYVGLRPKRSESGESQPQLPITKEGDGYLRVLLVQGAHHILSRRGPDTDLKRWGSKLAERGGKNAKKRAVVAVARRLAVLLHRLWMSGETYEPLRNSRAAAARQSATGRAA